MMAAEMPVPCGKCGQRTVCIGKIFRRQIDRQVSAGDDRTVDLLECVVCGWRWPPKEISRDSR